MRSCIQLIVLVLALTGCATPLSHMDTDFLCQHYGSNAASTTARVPAIRAELNAQKLISEKDWEFIDRGQLYVGMPRCAMFAIKGGVVSVNNSTTATGTLIQHVFLNHSSLKREYVYTRDGLVTAWQY